MVTGADTIAWMTELKHPLDVHYRPRVFTDEVDQLAAGDRSERLCQHALIVITDGCGAVPTEPPPFPLLWVITPDGRNMCPFGATLTLPKHG